MSRSIRTTATLARQFTSSATSSFASSSTSHADGERKSTVRGVDPDKLAGGDIDVFTKVNEHNDVPWMGYLKMFSSTENLAMVEKIHAHEEALKAHRTEFVPPTKPIRVSQTIDLLWPEHRINHRRSAIIPVASLPLKDADAIKRCKLIAGPKWTPGRPGVDETAYQTNRGYNGGADDIGKEGWLKMTGEKLDNGRMNRKMISDNLDRLIQAANDPKSPVPVDIPLDTRHIVARERRRDAALTHAQRVAKASREVGLDGFPKEWLSEEVKAKAFAGRAGPSSKVQTQAQTQTQTQTA